MIQFTSQLMRLTRHFINRLWFSTNKNPEEQGQKVFIDEQSIQRKIKELKQRSQNVSTDDKKRKKTKEFMPVFTIPEVNEKVNQFRRDTNTEDLFAFSDITLEEKPTILQITGYDTDFMQVDSFEYPPCVILTPNQVLNWQVQSPALLKIDNFAILKCLAPIPDYVIIGVPDASVIKQNLREELKKLHPNIDILNLFEAISQFNTVVDNDKNCIAFMITFD